MVATSSPTGAGIGPSPFHSGEQQVQELTGARDISEQLGRAWLSKELSATAAVFFSQQQLLYTASRNQDGRLWASALAGPRGFLSSPSPAALTVRPFRQFSSDPAELNIGDHIGTLGITLETRRRERLNGIVESKDEGSLTIAVRQSFSGCPKYIQARKVEVVEDRLDSVGDAEASQVTKGDTELGSAERDFIERSDTLFIATCYFGELEAGNGEKGCDNSHRGGPPGFVQVSGPGTLRFADYVGNYTFTTLGNLHADPRASIHFLDFATGDSLQLSGSCSILWDECHLPGAQRTMEFQTEKWVHVRRALPLSAPAGVNWSPYNPLPTWKFDATEGKDRMKQLVANYVDPSEMYRMLRCLSAVRETPDITTFEFEGDIRGLVKDSAAGNRVCDPGQFASFDFPDVTPGESTNRTWTISSPQAQIRARQAFTISIKKAGLVSTWMSENMRPGRTICFRGVDGDFTLDRMKTAPPAGVLLVAGGIGVTPMRPMFHECIVRGIPVTLLYSVRTLADAAFLHDLQEAAAAAGKAAAAVALTLTGSGEAAGMQNGHGSMKTLSGRVNAAMIQQVCADVLDRTVFQCGPPSLTKTVSAELASISFPLQNLHQESFAF